MKRAFIQFLLAYFLFCAPGYAQDSWQYFIVANANLYTPLKSEKGMYPIVGFNKETKPKLLIGGFGAGFTAWKKLNAKVGMKAQTNLSRSVYWESFLLNDGPLPSDITGEAVASSADYTFGLTGTMHYYLTPRIAAGTGLGAQVLLGSYLYLRNAQTIGMEGNGYLGRNRYYKTVMPIIPIEFTVKLEKFFVNLRYEYALLDRLKKDLADYKTETYGLLFFEFGFRIK
ncbi:hypothetical protein [Chryseolinea sp. H1M3-3]|uniref:hypothetical protein n=1 Tax=Chryseolinea sp. H1M3-3 TaxID=3034144 RepID=UPI0023EC9049|nr:hypothetical protein [Chryseolinea sp. H1M3-3]